MSYQINLGQWNSVFAVPSSLVEKHLKLATESQLKVILYILNNSREENTAQSISKALSISEEEVKNSVDFWIERELLVSFDNALIPAKAENKAQQTELSPPDEKETEKEKPLKHTVTRVVRPDPATVARFLNIDENLRGLQQEAQEAFSKPLSSGDTAVIVMLYHDCGLPCDVIAMLIHYCVSIGKANMRAIEKIGLSWSDKGIDTVELAEEEIRRMGEGRNAWSHVSALFGIRNVGNPTQAQIDYADRWLNGWNFSDEMLTEAYERCVNTKGEYHIRYINAILSKWYEKGIKSLDALKESEAAIQKPKKKVKKSAFSFENTSYDVTKHKSLFDE